MITYIVFDFAIIDAKQLGGFKKWNGMKQYTSSTVNTMLIALNLFLRFLGLSDCCVKLVKIQRKIFCQPEYQLTQKDYHRLIYASRNSTISLIIQTIFATGIRVSDLSFITVEAVRRGQAAVHNKNKNNFHPVLITKNLTPTHKKDQPES